MYGTFTLWIDILNKNVCHWDISAVSNTLVLSGNLTTSYMQQNWKKIGIKMGDELDDGDVKSLNSGTGSIGPVLDANPGGVAGVLTIIH